MEFGVFPVPNPPFSVPSADWFAAGMLTTPWVMWRSEAESTAAGVGSMFEIDPVSGIRSTSSCRFRITGALLLVTGIGMRDVNGVGEISSWAM